MVRKDADNANTRPTKKRKTQSAAAGSAVAGEGATSEPVLKKHRATWAAKGKAKAAPLETSHWPDYFDSLFKVGKGDRKKINLYDDTRSSHSRHIDIQGIEHRSCILLFAEELCDNIPGSAPVRRGATQARSTSLRPLDLAKVAELKALLPDIVRFAYIPRAELRIHSDSQRRDRSPDYSAFDIHTASGSSVYQEPDEDEHVLVLDFVQNSRGKKSTNPGFIYALPPALTPEATKKVVNKRNERFIQAVNELLEAISKHEDPVALLQAAARDHIPVDPSSMANTAQSQLKGPRTVPEPADRPTIDAIIEEIQKQEWFQEQIAHRRTVEARDGIVADLESPLSETVFEALQSSRKIASLYTHQVAAITALSRGRNVIVSTSTASGKSIIYQVPVLRYLEEDPSSTAMFIYPTKALAQDQKLALEQLLYSCPGLGHVKVFTYDGDTPQEQRAGIRELASVIFTNFDMMHASILPHEDLWRRFLKNLKIVAVDELHYYSDVFGSHVAQVMRRFRRVCAAVGNRRCRFVSCSATISHPKQHMENIFGIEDVEEITEDGAPSGRKDYLVWNPPLIDPMDESLGRRGSMSEATRLMRFLMARGVRVILFCKIRKSCELAMKMLRAELTADGRHDILQRVMAYRGGYSQQDRRRIEREAFSGNLLGIVATNALELGVDIGVLDAVIMLGFPIGGIASFRQQAGRAGRRARDALAVFVADSFPIDQHYVNNPDELFDKPTNDLVLDLESKVLLEAHLQCAAHEMPLMLDDEQYFGPTMKELCETRLVKDKEGWYHTHSKFLPFPAKHISLRGGEEEKYSVVDITKVEKPGGSAYILEEIELSRALFETYEGAIFIHQGLTFIVKEVSHDSKMAKLIRSDVNWITEPRDFTNVDAAQTYRIREIRGSPFYAYYGRVELKTVVFGYFKVRNKAIIDAVDLDTPPWERQSTGLWMDVPKSTLELMRDSGINPAEAIHAAEHAFLNRFALANDLKTECKVAEKEYKVATSQRKRPARLIFYEPTGKNGGIATTAFDHVSDILHDALRTVEACECEEGCARCIDSPSCNEGNLVSSKTGALLVLKAILGRPIDVDLIPEYPPEVNASHNTVVEATAVRAVEGVEVEKA